MVRYPWTVRIMYDLGGEFLSHEFKNSLIGEEYGINTNPDSSRKPKANTIIERIHQVLGNLVRRCNLQETYVDDAYPWMGILAKAAFRVRSTYHRDKQNVPGQLVFGRDMILPKTYLEYCRYIHQRKQMQINKGVTHENTTIIDHNYIMVEQVMMDSKTSFKYETTFKGPYKTVQTWTNG